MFSNKELTAQGTIEYLVIIAVVVVISLIVVALVITTTSSPSQQIKDSSSKLGSATSGGISIVEAVVDSNGDSLIKFSNNSGDVVYLNKVSVGSVDNNYDDSRRQLVGLDSKTFSLSGLSSVCPCTSGQKNVNCEFRIEYLTSTGLTKTEYKNIKVECVTDSIPVDDTKVIDPVVAVLENGTLANPWIINDCNELQNMNLDLDGNYILGNDVNCYTDTHVGGILYNSGAGFSPVGIWTAKFTGSFDGRNKRIYSLYMYQPGADSIGLFGWSKGTISNVGLIDFNIFGHEQVGALVGKQYLMPISNCYSTGDVNGYAHVGGLVGSIESTNISNSYSTVRTRGYREVGGLLGYDYISGTISSSYATGQVIGTNYVGGLIGYTYGTISKSYATGNVNGVSYVGGLIGTLWGGTIEKSYSIGTVNGSDYVGGLVGWHSQFSAGISNSFTLGRVTGSTNTNGLVGYQYLLGSGSISSSYWDIGFTTRSSCYKNNGGTDTNSGCTPTISDATAYQGTNGVTKLANDTNWIAVTGDYPILYWQ